MPGKVPVNMIEHLEEIEETNRPKKTHRVSQGEEVKRDDDDEHADHRHLIGCNRCLREHTNDQCGQHSKDHLSAIYWRSDVLELRQHAHSAAPESLRNASNSGDVGWSGFILHTPPVRPRLDVYLTDFHNLLAQDQYSADKLIYQPDVR